jgi:hypothetical protein
VSFVRSFVRSHFDFRAKRSERTETASHRVHARVVKRAPNNIYAPFFRSIFVPFASRGSELELELGRLPSAGVMFARARVPALYGFLSYETSPVRRAGWFGGARARIVSNRVQMSSPPPRPCPVGALRVSVTASSCVASAPRPVAFPEILDDDRIAPRATTLGA